MAKILQNSSESYFKRLIEPVTSEGGRRQALPVAVGVYADEALFRVGQFVADAEFLIAHPFIEARIGGAFNGGHQAGKREKKRR